jgi:hypothetical protein
MVNFTTRKNGKIMKTFFTYLAAATILASCSTAYKSGQTPDDLYYAKPVAVKQQNEVKEEQRRYESYQDVVEERNIRFGINNRRWRNFDEYDYNYNCLYNPYQFGYTSPYYFNPYFYQYPVFVGYNSNVKATVRTTNLNAYNGTITTYTNTKYGGTVRTNTARSYNTPATQPTRTYRQRNVSSDRTYSPSTDSWGGGSRTSGSSSSSSSSGGGAPVSRPTRGGR